MMKLLQLFWSFCKIGYTSFGGLSMIPLITSEMTGHGWMTVMEVSDIVAIAEMTPGPIGLNCATFTGIRVAGVIGAIVANLGVLMPTFTITATAALFFEKFKSSRWLKDIMIGVRPAALGIILAVMVSLCKTNYLVNDVYSVRAMGIGLLAFVLMYRFKWSVPKVITMAAILGLILL